MRDCRVDRTQENHAERREKESGVDRQLMISLNGKTKTFQRNSLLTICDSEIIKPQMLKSEDNACIHEMHPFLAHPEHMLLVV